MKSHRSIHLTLFFIIFCLQVVDHAFSIPPSHARDPETLTRLRHVRGLSRTTRSFG